MAAEKNDYGEYLLVTIDHWGHRRSTAALYQVVAR